MGLSFWGPGLTIFNTGVLISGGYNGTAVSHVNELFIHPDDVPQGFVPCFVPQLDRARWRHTMNNLTVCGGLDAFNQPLHICSKYDFTFGHWYASHNLKHSRCRHLSWDVDSILYLIGGDDTANAIPSYEILSQAEDSGLGSVTEYETQFQPQYVFLISFLTKITYKIQLGGPVPCPTRHLRPSL